MPTMTKRARIAAAIAGQPVDRVPVAFWRHVPEVDHTAKGLADAMLAFHRRWDLDLIKIMSSGVYCVEDWGCRVAYQGSPNGAKTCTEHAVKTAADWARLKALDPGAGRARPRARGPAADREGARRRCAGAPHDLLAAHDRAEARRRPARRGSGRYARRGGSRARDHHRHRDALCGGRARRGRRRVLLRHPAREP
jgi:hypothetical protein